MAISFDTTITFGTPSFGTAGRFIGDYSIAAPEYEKSFPDSPGTDGTGVKRFGFRQRRLAFSATYVNTSVDNVISAIETDFAQLANKAFTVALGSTSFYRCELDGPATRYGIVRETGLPGTAYYYARVEFSIVSKGLAA